MLNKTILLGRLAQDPTLRYTQTGTPVASFDLAVSANSSNREIPPDFIPIVCWKEQAEFVNKYLTKGRQIVVEGRISTRKYTDQEGKNRKVVEVVSSHIFFADSNPNAAGAQASSAGSASAGSGYQTVVNKQPTAAFTPADEGYTQIDDDELPF